MTEAMWARQVSWTTGQSYLDKESDTQGRTWASQPWKVHLSPAYSLASRPVLHSSSFARGSTRFA